MAADSAHWTQQVYNWLSAAYQWVRNFFNPPPLEEPDLSNPKGVSRYFFQRYKRIHFKWRSYWSTKTGDVDFNDILNHALRKEKSRDYTGARTENLLNEILGKIGLSLNDFTNETAAITALQDVVRDNNRNACTLILHYLNNKKDLGGHCKTIADILIEACQQGFDDDVLDKMDTLMKDNGTTLQKKLVVAIQRNYSTESSELKTHSYDKLQNLIDFYGKKFSTEEDTDKLIDIKKIASLVMLYGSKGCPEKLHSLLEQAIHCSDAMRLQLLKELREKAMGHELNKTFWQVFTRLFTCNQGNEDHQKCFASEYQKILITAAEQINEQNKEKFNTGIEELFKLTAFAEDTDDQFRLQLIKELWNVVKKKKAWPFVESFWQGVAKLLHCKEPKNNQEEFNPCYENLLKEAVEQSSKENNFALNPFIKALLDLGDFKEYLKGLCKGKGKSKEGKCIRSKFVSELYTNDNKGIIRKLKSDELIQSSSSPMKKGTRFSRSDTVNQLGSFTTKHDPVRRDRSLSIAATPQSGKIHPDNTDNTDNTDNADNADNADNEIPRSESNHSLASKYSETGSELTDQMELYQLANPQVLQNTMSSTDSTWKKEKEKEKGQKKNNKCCVM